MQTVACPTCGRSWPENYCPRCARTIDRTAVPVPTENDRAQSATPVSSRPNRHGFRRVFIIASGLQLAFYVLYWIVGTDRATSSFNTFGNTYALFYYPGVVCMWALVGALQMETGLRLAVVGLLFGPLIGIAGYSFIIAIAVALWQASGDTVDILRLTSPLQDNAGRAFRLDSVAVGPACL